MDQIITTIAQELGKNPVYIENVVKLLDEGCTIPFIARYRKEQHGAMEDTALRQLETRLTYLRGLEERRTAILGSLETQEKLTPQLKNAVAHAATLSELEEIYRPYKQKRRTRAVIAREKGLGPLAELLLDQRQDCRDIRRAASAYINEKKSVETIEDALQGASDIIAETISENLNLRKTLRLQLQRNGLLVTEAVTEDDTVYRNYYQFKSTISRLQNHQILAINRGEKEKVLKISVELDHDQAMKTIEYAVIHRNSPDRDFLLKAAEDSYNRLLFPSLERELRTNLTDRANEGSITQFSANLKQLLMQPPVKGKVTMGLDPGYRMGCKVAVVDPTGKVLDTTVVYPTYGAKQKSEAIEKLCRLSERYGIEHIAIGNGTASRETEQMAVELIQQEKTRGRVLSYMIVSEAGASVYSVSKLASEEFPEYDVNLRSAVSIARRLQDPLAELVKIEPKAIGVGQYQHDMPEKQLSLALDHVVEDCVNAVGADLNTASASLLEHISGLNSTIAKNIVAYREDNGAFQNRRQLLKVSKLGPKAYQQCAGFLRIPNGKDILDNTAVHPESYPAAKLLLDKTGHRISDVISGSLKNLNKEATAYGLEKLALELGIGVPTLNDIISEIMKPGRDIRSSLPQPVFRSDVLDIKDIKPGMILTGTVRNVIDFGAFIDIGVHQDGLVHISEIADRYIRHPSEVLSVGDTVRTIVLSVDEKKKRISLSIRQVSNSDQKI